MGRISGMIVRSLFRGNSVPRFILVRLYWRKQLFSCSTCLVRLIRLGHGLRVGRFKFPFAFRMNRKVFSH